MDKFEVTIIYEKEGKKTSESYLFYADSHAEAENLCLEEVCSHIDGDYIIADVKRKRYAEVHENGKDYYFNATIACYTIDEKTGVEKKKNISILVNADTIREVLDVTESLDGSNETIAVSRTRIVDVFSK